MDDNAPALETEARVYAGQVEILYFHVPIGISATILNGMIMVAVLWRFVPHDLLISWGAVLLALSITRFLIMLRYRRAADREAGARKWGGLFLAGMVCSGLVWGASVMWLCLLDSLELHLLIAFVIGGMVAGASATLSALRAAFYAFAVPALFPLTAAFFSFTDMVHASMGVMLLLFLFFLSMVAHSMHAVIRRSFQLRYEKDDLITSLEKSRRETVSALDNLRQEVQKRLGAERELRLLSRNLEREVRARTRELEHANRELNAFAYSVSHDLRAPARAINGFSRVLQQDFGELLGEKGIQYLNKVRRSVGRMNELIDDLLSLSRVSRQELRLCTCDLTGIARDIAEILKKSDPLRQVEFSIQEGLTGWCDYRLIRIVLENLIGNAWKFTRKRGHARIEFGVRKEENHVIFFVADNGVGFDMAYARKLFAPFQRLHSEEDFEGTGIGLATVQRIIYRHGGSIWAEAEAGKGATFFFTLKEGG